jgi:hypothetical protein
MADHVFAALVWLFRRLQDEYVRRNGYHREKHDAQFGPVNALRSVRRSQPDNTADRDHEWYHPPQRNPSRGVPCRLAVAPPLHGDAFSFDAWSKIETAADDDRSRSNENVIRGQQTSEPFFAGERGPRGGVFHIMEYASWKRDRFSHVERKMARHDRAEHSGRFDGQRARAAKAASIGKSAPCEIPPPGRLPPSKTSDWPASGLDSSRSLAGDRCPRSLWLGAQAWP